MSNLNTASCIINNILKLSVTTCIIVLTYTIYSAGRQCITSAAHIENAAVDNINLLARTAIISAQRFGDNFDHVANAVTTVAEAATRGENNNGVHFNVNLQANH